MKKKKILTVSNMVQIAMFAAILPILSQVSFELPGGIPVTLQTFGVVLIGTMLGPVLGFISLVVYLLLGAVGIPVFASFKSGLSVLVGPTGGYLIGFLPMVVLVGLGKAKSFYISITTSIAGLLACHVLGLFVYYQVTNTWLLPSVPVMLVKDIGTTIVAITLGREISKRLSGIFMYTK